MKRRLIILGADFAANGIVGQLEHDYQLLTDIASVDVPRGTIEISVESYMATYNDDVFVGSTPADITATADGGLTCTVGEPTGNIYPITIDGSAATSEECIITVTQPASNKVITIPATAIAYAIKASTNAPVMAVCYAQGWAANADYMTFVEAAAVTNLGTAFKENAEITTFEELEHFTGLTTIVGYAFQKCTALTRIALPMNVTGIGTYAFSDCKALSYLRIPYKCITFSSMAFFNVGNRIIDVENGWLTNYQINGKPDANVFAPPFKGQLYISGVPQNSITFEDSVNTVRAWSLIGLVADEVVCGDTITELGARAFNSSTIQLLDLGENVATIGSLSIGTTTTLIVRAITPPALAGTLAGVSSIYVPDASVDVYKAAENWSSSASKIYPLSQKP